MCFQGVGVEFRMVKRECRVLGPKLAVNRSIFAQLHPPSLRAKRSNPALLQQKSWIASSASLLAMTAEGGS